MRQLIQLVEGLFDEPEQHRGSFGWWVYPDGSIEEMEEAGNHGVTADGWLSENDPIYDNDDYDEAIAIVLERGGIRVSTFHGSDTMHIDAKAPTISARSSLMKLMRETRTEFAQYIVGEISSPVSYRDAISKIRNLPPSSHRLTLHT